MASSLTRFPDFVHDGAEHWYAQGDPQKCFGFKNEKYSFLWWGKKRYKLNLKPHPEEPADPNVPLDPYKTSGGKNLLDEIKLFLSKAGGTKSKNEFC